MKEINMELSNDAVFCKISNLVFENIMEHNCLCKYTYCKKMRYKHLVKKEF